MHTTGTSAHSLVNCFLRYGTTRTELPGHDALFEMLELAQWHDSSSSRIYSISAEPNRQLRFVFSVVIVPKKLSSSPEYLPQGYQQSPRNRSGENHSPVRPCGLTSDRIRGRVLELCLLYSTAVLYGRWRSERGLGTRLCSSRESSGWTFVSNPSRCNNTIVSRWIDAHEEKNAKFPANYNLLFPSSDNLPIG